MITILFSCKKQVELIDGLNFFNGVSDLLEDNNHNILFLSNLKDFNNIITLCFIKSSGDILRIYPVEKYLNVDVNSDYIRLFESKPNTYLLYESRGTTITIETFNDINLVTKNEFTREKNSIGSLFNIGENSRSIYLRGHKLNPSNYIKNYKCNYYILDSDLLIKSQGLIDLGDLYPEHLTLYNRSIFYTVDNQLLKTSIDSLETESIYNFENDVIQLYTTSNYLYVLLKNSIHIFDKSGIIIKSFNLLGDLEGYYATDIVNNTESTITVHLKNSDKNIFKIFSIHGNPISENIVDDIDILNSYIYQNRLLIYSTKSSIYLKDL